MPTTDTVKYSTKLDMMIQILKPSFFTGNTGVGKSIIISKFIIDNKENKNLHPVNLTFSAQTDSKSTQMTIEGKLEKLKGNALLGAKGNGTTVIFVDDINMPSVEKYGA